MATVTTDSGQCVPFEQAITQAALAYLAALDRIKGTAPARDDSGGRTTQGSTKSVLTHRVAKEIPSGEVQPR